MPVSFLSRSNFYPARFNSVPKKRSIINLLMIDGQGRLLLNQQPFNSRHIVIESKELILSFYPQVHSGGNQLLVSLLICACSGYYYYC